jgi:hypothetical protein
MRAVTIGVGGSGGPGPSSGSRRYSDPMGQAAPPSQEGQGQEGVLDDFLLQGYRRVGSREGPRISRALGIFPLPVCGTTKSGTACHWGTAQP